MILLGYASYPKFVSLSCMKQYLMKKGVAILCLPEPIRESTLEYFLKKLYMYSIVNLNKYTLFL